MKSIKYLNGFILIEFILGFILLFGTFGAYETETNNSTTTIILWVAIIMLINAVGMLCFRNLLLEDTIEAQMETDLTEEELATIKYNRELNYTNKYIDTLNLKKPEYCFHCGIKMDDTK